MKKMKMKQRSETLEFMVNSLLGTLKATIRELNCLIIKLQEVTDIADEMLKEK